MHPMNDPEFNRSNPKTSFFNRCSKLVKCCRLAPVQFDSHRFIRGHNPLTGSWLGHLLSMAAAESTLCILSSQHLGDELSCGSTSLVGGLVAMNFIFPYIGLLIVPVDFHIFQRGGQKPPTSSAFVAKWFY